jgi:type I restriction enzyme S subunit
MTNSKLGQISRIQAGPFGTQLHKSEYASFGVPMLNAKNIGEGIVLISSLDYVSNKVCKRLPQYLLEKGDIIFGRSGTIDKHVYIDDKYVGAFQGTNCIRVRLHDKKLAKYISYYLNINAVKSKISFSAGKTTQRFLTTENLEQVIVQIPDVGLALQIDSFLSRIDHKIEINNTINTKLEKLARTIYEYWFVQFDFPNAEGKPYKSSGGAMEYNEILRREIPKSWRADKLRMKLSFERGVEPGSDIYESKKSDTNIPFIRVADIGKIPELFIPINVSTNKLCEPHDVLVSFDGSIGKIAIAMKGSYSSGIRKIKALDADYSNALVYFMFQSELIQKMVKKYAVGSNILHAAGAIEHLYFTYDKTVVDSFIKKVETIYEQIVANKLQNLGLIALRDFLLPILINGQVVVGEVQGKVAQRISFSTDVREKKYQVWKQTAGIAARGDLDEQTILNIYEAMDTDDR